MTSFAIKLLIQRFANDLKGAGMSWDLQNPKSFCDAIMLELGVSKTAYSVGKDNLGLRGAIDDKTWDILAS